MTRARDRFAEPALYVTFGGAIGTSMVFAFAQTRFTFYIAILYAAVLLGLAAFFLWPVRKPDSFYEICRYCGTAIYNDGTHGEELWLAHDVDTAMCLKAPMAVWTHRPKRKEVST